MYQKIMIATDNSEPGKKAIKTGIAIAKLTGAKVYAVYVVASKGISLIPPRGAGWEKAMKEHLMVEGEEATTFVKEAGEEAGVEVEPVILEGDPGDEITGFAENNEIDLIVMGTQGKTGIKRFLIGSVAENVVRSSKQAVLVVRGEKEEGDEKEGEEKEGETTKEM